MPYLFSLNRSSKDSWMLKVKSAGTRLDSCAKVLSKENWNSLGPSHHLPNSAWTTLVIAIFGFYDFKLTRMDVRTAFLNPDVKEEIYVLFSEGLGALKERHKNTETKSFFVTRKVSMDSTSPNIVEQGCVWSEAHPMWVWSMSLCTTATKWEG